MKKLISTIFPIELHLNILQLEEYKYFRFLRWISKHFLQRKIETKKKLVITPKAKYILIISAVTCLLISALIFTVLHNLFLAIFTALFLLTQPYTLFLFALLTIKPYEIANKYLTIEKNKRMILANKDLKVIGITGSYGKSSTKEILYQLIKNRYRTLRTPESFNNIFGIDKFLEYEFDYTYEVLICEMAAYKKGEIKELCYMLQPNYGILTGITKQHLERFKSLQNIISAKFELLEAIPDPNKMVFNMDNQTIVGELKKRNINQIQKVRAKDIRFDKEGSKFALNIQGKSHPIKTTLFGMSQVKNILLACEMALKLNLSPGEIVAQINCLRPFMSRAILNPIGNCTIVDNTFSSNIESFNETINTALKVSGKKALITPGIVELGKEESNIHKELGKKARGIFEKIVLVGKNIRTSNLKEGLSKNSQVEFIEDKREIYFEKIQELSKNFDWIFLENDLTQNY